MYIICIYIHTCGRSMRWGVFMWIYTTVIDKSLLSPLLIISYYYQWISLSSLLLWNDVNHMSVIIITTWLGILKLEDLTTKLFKKKQYFIHFSLRNCNHSLIRWFAVVFLHEVKEVALPVLWLEFVSPPPCCLPWWMQGWCALDGPAGNVRKDGCSKSWESKWFLHWCFLHFCVWEG